MATYWFDGWAANGGGDGKRYRSLERCKLAARKTAQNMRGMDVVVYETAYYDGANLRGAHQCAGYEYEITRYHYPCG